VIVCPLEVLEEGALTHETQSNARMPEGFTTAVGGLGVCDALFRSGKAIGPRVEIELAHQAHDGHVLGLRETAEDVVEKSVSAALLFLAFAHEIAFDHRLNLGGGLLEGESANVAGEPEFGFVGEGRHGSWNC
jgi:hypothetical protein